MLKKAMLTGGLAALMGCNPNEFLIDVSGIATTVDRLEVYVASQATPQSRWMVSQRIVVPDVQSSIVASGGRYKMTLDHSLMLEQPGLAQVFVGAFAKSCFIGVGTVTSTLQQNNSGYSRFAVAIQPDAPPNQASPCSATQPVVTRLAFSNNVANDSTVSNTGTVYGWGFLPTSKVHITATVSMLNLIFQPVDNIEPNTEYFPDHLNFGLKSLSLSQLATLFTPSQVTNMGMLRIDKSASVINPGPPDVTSNDLLFK